MRVGGAFEGLLLGNDAPRLPPVFILGLQRSGSTLFFHSICNTFGTAHLVRLGVRLWFAPALTAGIVRRFAGEHVSDFQSHYGIGSSLASPFSGNSWNLWFERDAHMDASSLPAWRAEQIRRMVGRLERVFGCPFVDKNQRFNQWLPALAELFERSLFVITMRAPLGVSLSMLRARLELYGDFTTWVHARPRSFPALDNPTPEREVVCQARAIVEDLRADMEAIGAHRFAVVDYEQFCADPSGGLDSFERFLAGHGVVLTRRQPPPSPFEAVAARTDRLRPEQVEAVEAAVREFFPDGRWPALPCQVLGTPGESLSAMTTPAKAPAKA